MIDFACKKFELDEVIKCGLALTKSELSVLKFLINDKDEHTSQDISGHLHIDLTTAQRALKQLREKELVRRMQRNLSPGGYVYFYSVPSREVIKTRLMEIINNWTKRVEKEINNW